MGNEQSGFSQKHLIDPVDARISQQAREREAARLANQRQRSNQDSAPAPAPESRASNPLSNVERSTQDFVSAVKSPTQHFATAECIFPSTLEKQVKHSDAKQEVRSSAIY
jgi:hypothetical protein